MRWVIVAYDGKDKKAMERRMKARPFHFEGVEKLIEKKQLEYGGALLDDNGKMIGSLAVVDFKTRRQLDAYLKREPYIRMGVWKKITVTPFNRAV